MLTTKTADLPIELYHLIFKKLDLADILIARSTCKLWLQYSKSKEVWKRLIDDYQVNGSTCQDFFNHSQHYRGWLRCYAYMKPVVEQLVRFLDSHPTLEHRYKSAKPLDRSILDGVDSHSSKGHY